MNEVQPFLIAPPYFINIITTQHAVHQTISEPSFSQIYIFKPNSNSIIPIQFFQLYLMMTNQYQNVEPLISQLFRDGYYSNQPQDCLSYLERKGMIKYLGPRGFCQYINERIGETAKTFIGIFLNQVQNERSSKSSENRKLRFPLVISGDRQFEKKNLECFVTQYAKQFFGQGPSQIIPGTEQEIPTTLTAPEFYEINLNEPSEELPKKEQKTAKVEQQNLKPKKDVFLENSKQIRIRKQIKSNKQIQNDLAEEETQNGYTPQFFFRQEKAVYTLLGLNVTKFFQKELAEVKAMLKQHIQQGAFLEIYTEFLQEFVSLHHIKTGLCEPDEQRIRKSYEQMIEQLKSYKNETLVMSNGVIRYCREQQESPLIVYWREIRSNLEILLGSKKYQWMEQTKKALLKGLDSIVLTFTYNKSSYGMTFQQTIYINTNHNQNSYEKTITLDQYKRQTFPPYLVLTICHELAHFLVREFDSIQVNPNEASFTFNDQSIGCYIINLVHQNKHQLKSQFAMTPKLKLRPRQRDDYDQLFSDLNSSIIRATCQHRQMVQSLKDHHSEIDALNQLVLNIDGDFGKVRVDMKKMQIKVHWKSIKSHIEQLEKGISQPGFTPDETLENKYRLFYQFLLADYIASEWIKKQGIDREQYNHYRQRLQKLSPKTYQIDNEVWIKDIMCEKVKFSKEFQSYIFSQKVTLASLNNRIDQLSEAFDLAESKKYVERMKALIFQDINMASMFSNLKWPKQNFVCLQPESDRKLQLLSQLSFAYSTSMKFAKYSDYFAVKYELPSFFTNDVRIVDQSGYDIQSRLFPNFKSKIYRKDYRLMCEFYRSDQQEIGVEPQQMKEKLQHINIYMEGRRKTDPGIDFTLMYCSTHFAYRKYHASSSSSSSSSSSEESD